LTDKKTASGGFFLNSITGLFPSVITANFARLQASIASVEGRLKIII
jgi:hypothetical protein